MQKLEKQIEKAEKRYLELRIQYLIYKWTGYDCYTFRA